MMVNFLSPSPPTLPRQVVPRGRNVPVLILPRNYSYEERTVERRRRIHLNVGVVRQRKSWTVLRVSVAR